MPVFRGGVSAASTPLSTTLIGALFVGASILRLGAGDCRAWAGAVYCVRADGTAAGSGATGPTSDPDSCMNLLTFNRSVFNPGDTVLFSDLGGEYTGQLNPRSSGTPGQLIRLQAAPGEHPRFNGLGTHHQLIYLRRDYVALDGLEVYNGLLGADSRNVEIVNASHVILENMKIHGAGFAGIYVYARDADVTDITIRNNEVFNVGEQGSGLTGNIFVMADDERHVMDSSIYGNHLYNVVTDSGGGEAGISLFNVGRENAQVRNLAVYDNTIHDIEGDGVRLAAGVFDSRIYDNWLTDNSRHYRLGGAVGGAVSNNEIWQSNAEQNPLVGLNEPYDWDQAAVYLDYLATDNIIHDLVLDSNRNGIVLNENSGNIFFNIVVKDAQRMSIRNSTSALDTLFSDITVVHSTKAKYQDTSEFIAAVELGAGSNAALRNTLVYATGDATDGVVGVWMRDSTADVSYDGVYGFETNVKLDAGAQIGPGILMSDPLIENLPDGPFTLAAGSPLFDAGVFVAGIHDQDYRDIADQRIVGWNDIGAYKDTDTIPLLGDVNLDGSVNGLDVRPFMDILIDGFYRTEADMNMDEGINGLDVRPFVTAVLGGAGAGVSHGMAIPEPTAFALATIGLLGLVPWGRHGRKYKLY